MKNSPGSMIGGIGLTTCVRDVQLSRTMPITSSTSASSTPRMIVAFDCLRKPPELCRRVARNSLSSSALTRAPRPRCGRSRRRVSPAEYRCRPRPGQREFRERPSRGRCTMRPPTNHQRAGVPRVDRRPAQRSPDHPSARHRGDRGAAASSRRCSRPCSAPAGATFGPSMGAIFISDPDRPGLAARSPSHGMDERRERALAAEVADPAHPFSVAATSRAATFDREATPADRVGRSSAPTCR